MSDLAWVGAAFAAYLSAMVGLGALAARASSAVRPGSAARSAVGSTLRRRVKTPVTKAPKGACSSWASTAGRRGSGSGSPGSRGTAPASPAAAASANARPGATKPAFAGVRIGLPSSATVHPPSISAGRASL